MAITPTQTDFRFYNDDGSETTMTVRAPQTANITMTKGSNLSLFLRIGVQNSGAQAVSTGAWKLQFSKNGGAYADVTTATAGVRHFDSANTADNVATTQRLSGFTGTFTAGRLYDTHAGNTNSGMNGLGASEFVFGTQFVDADLVAGDTIDFKILYAGAVLSGGYPAIPRLTVAGGANLGNMLLTF